MRQNVRYRILTISNKVRVEVTLGIDDQRNPEYISNNTRGKNVSLSFFPYITINIIRPNEVDENGNRVMAPWNPSDSLSMTRFHFPIFLAELEGIEKDLRIPDLYTYQGDRLELNEAEARKIRRPFAVGPTTVELSAVVVVDEVNDTRVEGIKMKFNNEQSSVVLTLNELTSLLYTLRNMNIDAIVLLIYTTYMRDQTRPKFIDGENNKPHVDILPKTD